MKKKTDNKRRGFLKLAATAAAAASLPIANAKGKNGSDDIKWEEETDVLVVGSGITGMGAAIEAKEAGAQVKIIEKEDWFGGNSYLSGGHCQVPGSKMQKRHGVKDSPDWGFEDMYKLGEGRNYPELLRLYVENASDTSDWLEKLGLKWKDRVKRQFDARVPRTLSPAPSKNYPGERGISIMSVLHKRAIEKLNIPLLYKHQLVKIVRAENNGEVLGVEVKFNGKSKMIRAKKAVIIATGGFRSNQQMLRALDPRLDEPFVYVGYPNVEDFGEGHIASQEIGAGFKDMSYMGFVFWSLGTKYWSIWDKKSLPDYGGIDYHPPQLPNMILVDNKGNRFCNEDTFDSHYTSYRGEVVEAYLALPHRPRKMWMIVDKHGAKKMKWPTGLFHKFDSKNYQQIDRDLIAHGSSISRLARDMGISSRNLKLTIERYNRFAMEKNDDDFNRSLGMIPIVTPPFYASRVIFNMGDQSCGIRVNSKLQVIDDRYQSLATFKKSVSLDKEKVIPKLYAAGECIGGLFGAERGHGKMISYLVLGRFAGRNSAKG